MIADLEAMAEDGFWTLALANFTAVMPARKGWYAPLEKLAKELAGGIGPQGIPRGSGDIQPWTPPVKTPIDYPEGKNLQTRIPLDYVPKLETSHSGGELFTVAEYYGTDLNTPDCDDDHWPGRHADAGWDRSRCWPVCRHTGDQCPTHPRPQESVREVVRQWVPIPDPEPADTLPGDIGINAMSFDDKWWLDTMPLPDFAMVGWTQLDNAIDADDNGMNVAGTLQRGEYWREQDRKHRKASAPKLSTEDASQPPRPLRDSLAGLRGRKCKNCLRLVPEDLHGNALYCRKRCRTYSGNVTRRGLVGTVDVGTELSSYAVAGKRVGIDTDNLSITMLLAG